MSTRPQVKPAIVIDGSMSGNLISTISAISNISMINYAFSWTGTTPIGTISIQASNDVKLLANGQPDPNNPGTWNTLPLSLSGALVTSVPVSGSSGNGMIDVDAQGCYATRAVYTAVSGTGTLIATVNAKVT